MYPRLKFFSFIIVTLLVTLFVPQQIAATPTPWDENNQEGIMHDEEFTNLPSAFCLDLAQTAQNKPAYPIGWQEFSPPATGFSISMPGKPTEQLQPGSTENKAGDLHLFLVFMEGETVAYGVGYRDLPNYTSQLNPSQINQFLNASRDEIVKNDKLLSDRSITLAGYPGREIAVESSQGFFSKIRIYLVQGRLYQMVVGSATKAVFPKEAEQFFNSFKLLAGQAMENKGTPELRIICSKGAIAS